MSLLLTKSADTEVSNLREGECEVSKFKSEHEYFLALRTAAQRRHEAIVLALTSEQISAANQAFVDEVDVIEYDR